jgi:HK97 gp10 family phage protein
MAAKAGSTQTFSMGLNLDDLQDFVEKSKEKIQSAVRPAAQAGAQVLYEAVKSNAGRNKKTGNLERSIYQKFSESNSSEMKSTYHVSWNHIKAPHGRLVEFGHIQRYKVYVGSDGNWYTAVRRAMQGKPKPKRNASQAVKDAYYVPLPSPKYVPAIPLVRSAVLSHGEKAVQAMRDEFARRMK